MREATGALLHPFACKHAPPEPARRFGQPRRAQSRVALLASYGRKLAPTAWPWASSFRSALPVYARLPHGSGLSMIAPRNLNHRDHPLHPQTLVGVTGMFSSGSHPTARVSA